MPSCKCGSPKSAKSELCGDCAKTDVTPKKASVTRKAPLHRRLKDAVSPETVERALLAYAVMGSKQRAAEYLGTLGIQVVPNTIETWATSTFADRYGEICDQNDDRISKVTAAEMQNNIRGMNDLVTDYIGRMKESAHTIKPSDLPSALRNVAVAQGVTHDKVNIIRGRPSSIVEHRSIDDILRKLSGFKVATVIDSTAIELPESSDEPEANPEKAP